MYRGVIVHLPDGVLPGSVCICSAVGAVSLTALGLRGISDRLVPRLAVLTALFFAIGTVHVRVGPGSVHLLCTGILAVVVGWRAIVPVAIGVLMHALLLQHGGLTTIGVNILVLGVPAMVMGAASQYLSEKIPTKLTWCLGVGATVGAYLLSMLLFLLVISFVDQRLTEPIGIWAAMHVPVMLFELVVAGATVAYLAKVQKGAVYSCCCVTNS